MKKERAGSTINERTSAIGEVLGLRVTVSPLFLGLCYAVVHRGSQRSNGQPDSIRDGVCFVDSVRQPAPPFSFCGPPCDVSKPRGNVYRRIRPQVHAAKHTEVGFRPSTAARIDPQGAQSVLQAAAANRMNALRLSILPSCSAQSGQIAVA